MTDIAILEQNLRNAEAALAAAKREADEARRVEYAARMQARQDAANALPDSAYFLDEPMPYTGRYSVHDSRPYVLPFGREYGKWNPMDVDNAAFGKSWLANSQALICTRLDQPRSKPSRLIFTSGVGPSKSDLIGTVFEARHDQTGSRLGDYRIVGIVEYDTEGNVSRILGEVPDVKLSQNTYK